MIKKFIKYNENIDEEEYVEVGGYSILELMERLKDHENRMEYMTAFLAVRLTGNMVSFTNDKTQKIEKFIIKDVRTIMRYEKEGDSLKVQFFMIDTDTKSYPIDPNEKITRFRKVGKRYITPEDPYGEEEW